MLVLVCLLAVGLGESGSLSCCLGAFMLAEERSGGMEEEGKLVSKIECLVSWSI